MRGLSLVVASGGHSSLRCAGLSLSRPLLLRSTGSRRAGSVAVAHGPSCSAACGIFPDQGSNPCPLHWQADSQPLRHQGSPSVAFFADIFSWENSGLYTCLQAFCELAPSPAQLKLPPALPQTHWSSYLMCWTLCLSWELDPTCLPGLEHTPPVLTGLIPSHPSQLKCHLCRKVSHRHLNLHELSAQYGLLYIFLLICLLVIFCLSPLQYKLCKAEIFVSCSLLYPLS